jgi:hypothetical protein
VSDGSSEDRIALDDATAALRPVEDTRPRMEEPPPVSLVAVADVTLQATRGLESSLDDFYVGILEFVRDDVGENLAYRADNFCLRFEWHEGLVERQSLRPAGIEVESLGALERKLFDQEIDFQFDRGLMPGGQCILVSDPAGNSLQIYEQRIVG